MMLIYELGATTRPARTRLKFQVYAADAKDAFTLGRAYLLTQGLAATLDHCRIAGAEPHVTKPGIVAPRRPSAALLVMHTAGGHADALPAEESGNRRWYAEPCRWDADPHCPPRQPDPVELEAPPRQAAFKAGRGYINLYERSTGNVQSGNVYTTREEAQRASKYPERNVIACITWDPAPKKRPSGPPVYFSSVNATEQAHLANRLRAWAGMPDPRATVSVYGAQRYNHLNITVGSPKWGECLDALRAWLTKNGVPYSHRKGSTTVIEVKWDDLGALVWPL